MKKTHIDLSDSSRKIARHLEVEGQPTSTIAVFLQYSLCHNCDPQPQCCGNRHRDLFTDSTNTDGDMKVYAKLRMILKLNSSTVSMFSLYH